MYHATAMQPAQVHIRPERPDYLPQNRSWQGIASMERTAGGRLFATFYSGSRTEENGNYVPVLVSDDDGRTWEDPFLIIHHPDEAGMRCFDPNLWIDPLGRLWITWAQSHEQFDGRDGVWAVIWEHPDDPLEAIRLSEPRRIANGIMMNKPTVLKSGEWLFPCAVWSCWPASEEHPEMMGERFSSVYVTRDQGKTFFLLGSANVPDRFFDEHMVVQRRDGSLWMLVRARYGIGQAFSRDGGRTWVEAGPTDLGGPNSRFFIRRLQSGNLLLVNHVNFTGRNNLMAKISRDDGLTWEGGLMLDERKDVSYPDGKQAEDGRIYIAYDRERYHDREVLMAVFTEEDVLAGEPVSDACRLRVPVSHAGYRKDAKEDGSDSFYKNALEPAIVFVQPTRGDFLPVQRHWQGIPTLERTAKGRLFAALFSGGKTEENGNYVSVMVSDDDGSTWEDPVLIIQHPDMAGMRCYDPNLWLDPLGRLWITWAQVHDFFDGRAGVWAMIWENPDDPLPEMRLSKPRRIANGVKIHKPTVLSNGDWLFPCAVWSCWEPAEHHPELAHEVHSNVYLTRDHGENFTLLGGAEVPDRFFDEHMVVERRDGSLWMLVRTRYGIGQAFSHDGGRTWVDEGPTELGGPNSRFFIRRLQSGNLLLVNHVNFTGRNNLMAKISRDDGKTWEGGLMLDERREVSYPDGKQAEDGRIYITYDHERYDAREVLMAVFTEEDVLAGEPVSDACRLRVLVSKATGEKKK